MQYEVLPDAMHELCLASAIELVEVTQRSNLIGFFSSTYFLYNNIKIKSRRFKNVVLSLEKLF
jgi:hypothetical protein